MGRNFRHLNNLLSSQNSATKIIFLFSFMYSQIQTYKFCTHHTHTHTLPEQAQNAKYENDFLLGNTEIYVGW